ncbi:MAG TPA: DoxX family protein [Polyangiaceae bacterium]|jgi:uncharacterized membrane protein YphA (DoxX/SURF4 family)|nr:DoxX family protein [Polyangiaceae bacterium]
MSKQKLIGYWVTTGLFAAAFLASGVAEVSAAPAVVQVMRALGYPLYFLTILGVWKILGAAALLAPGLPRLKEWAYAGIFFDLTGAAFSHASSGDPAGKVVMPVVFLLLAAASWALRPAARAWKPDATMPKSGRAEASREKVAAHA